jgi:predicted  nucleic acid-binding Zn-ribbon protein
VKETLLLLLELQELENSLTGLKEITASLDMVRTENRDSLELFDRLLGENSTQLEEILSFCKTTQAEIDKASDDARRARQRMNAITSQKELNALNKEIETARRNNSSNTEELKKLQAQYDEAKAAYEKRVADIEAMKAEMQSIEDNMVGEIEQRTEQSSNQRARKEAIHGIVDRPVLSRFNRVMAQRGGVAISEVKNEICSGCRMKIPPQQYNRVLRMNSMETCQQCSRMLVYREGFAQDQSEAG